MFNSIKKVVSIGVVAGHVLTFGNVSTVSAQTSISTQSSENISEKELDEVTVTASPIELSIANTAKLATVITRSEIERAPVQSIQELLNYAVGIDVQQRGGHGVQADISIRGGLPEQTAILLNGINLSNSQTGHYNFDIPINLSDIERIEIIQGPSSLIYGVNALSGGINIITKKDTDTKAYIRLGGGMHKMYEEETRGTSKVGITSNQLSFGYNTSDGYTANSDYAIYNALWQTRLNLKKHSKVDFQLGYNNKKYGANTFYSGLYPNQYEQTNTYLGSVKGSFGSDFKLLPNLYWTRHHDQFDLIKNSPKGRNHHRNDMYGGGLMLQYTSRLGVTSFNSDLRKEEILSSNLGKTMGKPHGAYYTHYDSRTNTSVAAEHRASIDKFVVSAGVLMNHNTFQEGKYSFYPSMSLNYRPIDKVSISTSWSKATRMPSFTDIDYSTETHIGNKALKPEQSESVDLAFKYKNEYISTYINGYLIWGRNMIDQVRANPTDKWASWNHPQLNKQGVELGVKIRLGEFIPPLGKTASLALEYARLHQSGNENELESKYCLNYLRDKFTAQLNHGIYKGWSAGWYFRFQNRMGEYDKIENGASVGKHSFPAYSTLDFKIKWKVKDIESHIAINNVFDKSYFDLGNVPQAGFCLMGGISYTLR